MNTDVSTQYYNDNLESSKIYFKSLLTKRTKIQILEINYNKNLKVFKRAILLFHWALRWNLLFSMCGFNNQFIY